MEVIKVIMLKVKNCPIQLVLDEFSVSYPNTAKKIGEIFYADFFGTSKIMIVDYIGGIDIIINENVDDLWEVANELKEKLVNLVVDKIDNKVKYERELKKFERKIEQRKIRILKLGQAL